MPVYRPIGAILLNKGLIAEKDLNQALAMQGEVGGLLGQALQRLGSVTEEALLEALSEQLELPIAGPEDAPAAREPLVAAAERLGLTANWCLARRAVLWISEPDHANGEARYGIHVLAADPLNLELRESVDLAAMRLTESLVRAAQEETDAPAYAAPRVETQYYLGLAQTIDRRLALLEQQRRHEDDDEDFADAARLREMAEEAPVIDFVNNILATALKEHASDIHVEAFEHDFAVRYRIDGVLRTRQRQGRRRFDAIASRIKLIAGMDIAERRLPQDGRHTIRFAGNDIDLRVSSVPSTWGESLVLRLLRKQTELPDLEGLGLTGRAGEVMADIIQSPNGILLVTGPTGSGKSTTLYRGLEKINDGYRKIITIEDPVEYDIEGVTQIQVKADIGYTFASGLRAILRQDPDVIMVGEIRDGETATIAAQAALTGHFVLSTLHTNSALAAVTRLEDIGLEPFLIGASVRGLMAQRLVRRLCSECMASDTSGRGDRLVAEAKSQGAPIKDQLSEKAQWRRAVGCEACDDTGYRGRIAVFEIARMDDALREAVLEGAPLRRLFEIARAQGFTTLFEDGLMKARAGETTIDEVYRVCGADVAQ